MQHIHVHGGLVRGALCRDRTKDSHARGEVQAAHIGKADQVQQHVRDLLAHMLPLLRREVWQACR